MGQLHLEISMKRIRADAIIHFQCKNVREKTEQIHARAIFQWDTGYLTGYTRTARVSATPRKVFGSKRVAVLDCGQSSR